MTIEKLLDLARVKVLAAADHHVLDAADDVAITLRVDHGDVAGMHPAIGVEHVGGFFSLIPIAQHDAVAAGAEFAAFAAGHDAAFEIDDLDLDMGVNAADRGHPALQRVVGRALKTDRAGLGHAVGDRHLAPTHAFIDPPHHLHRARR